MSEARHPWPEKTVESAMARIIDYRGKTPPKSSSGIPLVTAKVIKGGRILEPGEFIAEDYYDEWMRRGLPRSGDVVITTEAPMGEVGQLATDRVALAQRVILLRGRPDVLDNTFLKFALQWREVQQRLRARVTGTTVTGIKQRELRQVLLPVPPLDEQRRIAAVLGALDDKIELNRKMNRTLEEMAQAIFKSWFIDFDGHDDLVDSEIGPIPRGWHIGGIDAVAQNVRDTVDPRSLPGDTPYVGLEHVPRRCVALDAWGRASDAGSTKTRFSRGETLFGKLRPYFHKIVPAPVDGVCSTDILVIRAKDEDWRWFAFGHLYSDAMVAHTTAASDGTKMPRTNWKDICRFPIAIPPRVRAAEYGRRVTPMFERIAANVQESRTLAELRDTLLPKLISGELRVPEAEQLMEAAS